VRATGDVHETYPIDPRDTDERSIWRTEIGWARLHHDTGSVAASTTIIWNIHAVSTNDPEHLEGVASIARSK
jgi:hypothetical protein